MMIHEITVRAGRYKARKRVGRGKYGARGKTSGRGQKGAGSRSGTTRRFQFEGGQMPLFRRLPKFGFSNARFRTESWIVNLRDIVAHPSFASGGEVNARTLIAAGLVRDTSRPLKILGTVGPEGVSVPLRVVAERVSASARRWIENAGGTVTELGTRRDRVRGIDRAGGDLTPKNLTRKLKRARRRLHHAAQPAASGGSSAQDGTGKARQKKDRPADESGRQASAGSSS